MGRERERERERERDKDRETERQRKGGCGGILYEVEPEREIEEITTNSYRVTEYTDLKTYRDI